MIKEIMEEERKPGFFERLKNGLKKSREGFASDIDAVFLGHEKINDDLYEELEEVLIMGDVGVNTTEDIIESLKKSVKENRAKIPGELKNLLYEDIRKRLSSSEDMYDYERFHNQLELFLKFRQEVQHKDLDEDLNPNLHLYNLNRLLSY